MGKKSTDVASVGGLGPTLRSATMVEEKKNITNQDVNLSIDTMNVKCKTMNGGFS